jgi:hypothetical protein
MHYLYDNIKHLSRDWSIQDTIIGGFEQTDAAFHRQSRLQFDRSIGNACLADACALIALVVVK